ncbi:MAG: hypothetical protein BRC33_03900 [Cyanobacteria bacterium SW_9_44_58]|nr:MAG: hypothetical protein BRC33_03900 [Cyanobacteria bacterium SW_9_44_58]
MSHALKLYNKELVQQKTTFHYPLRDRAGNAVSVAYTINSFFGAGAVAEGTGFFLNIDSGGTKATSRNQYRSPSSCRTS